MFYYGGDYNPEQWPPESYPEDFRLMRLAGVNTITLGVFSWSLIQPDENTFDFSCFDRIMELAEANHVRVILATPTAATPLWMAKRYPEVMRTECDGIRYEPGGRYRFCPSSPIFKRFSFEISRKLAERYGHHPALAMWHIGNEYSKYCFCPICAEEFRRWLRKRYGSLDELNYRWNSNFWSRHISDWDEIDPPSYRNELLRFGGFDTTMAPGFTIDYCRFMSDQVLAHCKLQIDAVKAVNPAIPCTTNFLFGTLRTFDYERWARELDLISWDNYPMLGDRPDQIALRHAFMRGLKPEKPFLIMEQTPSNNNWRKYVMLRRPGELAVQSMQAIGMGADSILYFQLRQSRGGCEKYHGALISHGNGEHSRVFRECAQIGEELNRIAPQLSGTTTRAEAAILFDFDNFLSLRYAVGMNQDLDCFHEIENFFRPFHDSNIPCDIVYRHGDFSRYKLIIAPLIHMVTPELAAKLEKFTADGGTLLLTFFSGHVDENDLIFENGYPGPLSRLAGLRVEELEGLPPERANTLTPVGSFCNESFPALTMAEVIHPAGAVPLMVYDKDFYAGSPAFTVNAFGNGRCYYLASSSTPEFFSFLISRIAGEIQLKPVMNTPENVEAMARYRVNDEGGETKFITLVNHARETRSVVLPEFAFNLLSGHPAPSTLELPPLSSLFLSFPGEKKGTKEKPDGGMCAASLLLMPREGETGAPREGDPRMSRDGKPDTAQKGDPRMSRKKPEEAKQAEELLLDSLEVK